ncbi:MAG: homoserine dehydrogenase [Proteobacteria bacterium]|nr:homoserine dehydrogenase [Pseudomonadota bacterium]
MFKVAKSLVADNCLPSSGASRHLAPRPGLRVNAEAFDVARTGGSQSQHLIPEGEGFNAVAGALGTHGPRILIDATASDAVAEQHAHWLAQGIHVVTACKLGQGTALARWRAIRAACAQAGTHYGDAATVGAGLPLLRSLRELRAGGDRIHAIAGVLSGSLAWLCNHYDGMRPFSALVRAAREAGYTEPDPREDLSGEDVRRKLLILARSAGFELEADAVAVDSLVPPTLREVDRQDVDARLTKLDAPLRERYAQAYKRGEKLRFIARLERDADGLPRARVGLEALPPEHPLAGGAGTDNRLAIWSDRYREQPLLIQGPGAGAQVTAAALLDDVLRIARESASAV